MSETAGLFAGQGAQKPGMGKSLYECSPAAKAVIDKAEEIIPGLKFMCFEGDADVLNQTVNTQPCVFAVDMAAYAALKEAGIRISAAAGFSLGEYAALTAAGVFSFENALRLVADRAARMQTAAEEYPGGMVAVLGKSAEEVESVVAEVRDGGVLEAVNFNCPGQTVVAGDEDQLNSLISYCKAHKIKCVKLPVSGAFHTPRMAEVSDRIADALNYIPTAKPEFPVYANMTALPYGCDEIKRKLPEHTQRPVKFEQSVRDMITSGINVFVELGPGTTLTGFVKRISKDVKTFNINDEATLKNAAQALKGGKA